MIPHREYWQVEREEHKAKYVSLADIDNETFDKLFEALLEIGKEYKAYCLKIDPEIVIENTDISSEKISIIGAK